MRSKTEENRMIFNEAKRRFMRKYMKEIDRLIYSSIYEWYHSYKPKLYNRKEGYYDAYKIIDDAIVLNSDWISGKHRIDKWDGDGKDYLYINAFREGYHGGAISGDNPTHPEEGVPYWRKPSPHYNEWFDDPAIQTKSILNIIKEKIKEKNYGGKFAEILIRVEDEYEAKWGRRE